MEGENRRFGTGFVHDPPDERDRMFTPPPRAGRLPPAVDLSPKYPPALDQGTFNTCTSNATANALLFLERSLGEPSEPQSRLFIYWYGRKLGGFPATSDTGLNIRDAMKAVAQFHSVPETAWPYEPTVRMFVEPDAEAKRLSQAPELFAYEKVEQNEASIKQALAAGHPVILGIFLRESIYNVGSDGVCVMTGGEVGWHAVAIVGYNDATRRFKFQNSWSASWGANGFFELDYAYVTNPATASDLWTITAFDDTPGPPAPPPKVVFTIRHGEKVLTASGSFASGSTTTWDMTPVGPDTYTLKPTGNPTTTPAPIGTSPWVFACINAKLRVFTIGTPDGKQFLTVGSNGGVTLQPRLGQGQGAANQQFTVK